MKRAGIAASDIVEVHFSGHTSGHSRRPDDWGAPYLTRWQDRGEAMPHTALGFWLVVSLDGGL